MSFELLNTNGFRFTEARLPLPLLTADYGDGYEPPAAITGNPAGVLNWSVSIGVLPNDVATPRAEYLWNFWLARKAAGDGLFWVQDPRDGLYYLAGFVDDELGFEVLCAKAFASGLQLRQRRDAEQASPVSVLPGAPQPEWPIFGDTEFGG